jgi:epoxyqueuosine reductase
VITTETIRKEIERMVDEDPRNRHDAPDAGPYFAAPLIGFAAASDPLFVRYRKEEIIGSFHLSPQEFFEDAFGENSFPGGTVISWVLPIAEDTRRRNRDCKTIPCEQWAKTRDRGEKFNTALRRHLVEFLTFAGHRAVAPLLSPLWKIVMDTQQNLSSTWSERHAAYAAGLGTFSLNDGLITPRGIAHRVGSVITDLVLEPSVRPYKDHREYCLFFSEGGCGACIKRCPAGALSEQGHDKLKCLSHLAVTMETLGEKLAITSEAGCGLCQTGVPCESRIPGKIQVVK